MIGATPRTDAAHVAQRASPGARGRIGIIQPAPGVMLEHEWPRWLPDDVLFPVARIRMSGTDADGYQRLADATPDAARDLASASCDVIAYACTIGSLFAGAAAEAACVARMADAAGKPAISLAATSVKALRHVGARRLAIVTPYNAATNAWVRDYVESQGFAVTAFVTTPLSIVTVGSMQPAEIADFAAAAMARLHDADALWIPCTAIRTMAALADIEARTGRPVVSGTQALLWHALDVLAVRDPIVGAGRLFDVA